jgi:Fic family protein
MTVYIHQLSDWPRFRWDQEALAGPLAELRHRQGRLLVGWKALDRAPEGSRAETLTLEVLKSSEIGGETLDAPQVRSSIARRLGIGIAGVVAAEPDVEGVVEMTLDAIQDYADH